MLEPYQKTRGWLNERYSRVIFRGSVDLSRISLASPSENSLCRPRQRTSDTTAVTATATPSSIAPAIAGSAGTVKADRGCRRRQSSRRFGGLASRNGYTLSASFTEVERSDWVRVELAVTADASQTPNYTDPVEFFLHPTFNPSRMQATFRGHSASLSVKAWGGFTVGAWLPKSQTELECDLAELLDAPRIIREL